MDLEYCPYCMSPVKPGEPCGTCMLTAGSYTPAARHLPPGTVLQGRYLLGRVLGEGGFGITYIGRDLVLGLKVAVKEYFPADKATRDAGTSMEVSSYMGNSSSLYLRGKANFLREAQTIARLDRQPNIVSVKDFFEANNTAYIIMEYIDGTTFKDLVDQRGGKLPAWELLHLIEPMFSALSAMHDLGLIHRDISPENLMLEQGTVRLLDFGCARESANGDATMTIMLRHGYAPLEQYQSASDGQGPWTDIYALSATIYYCITGKKPPQAMDRLLEDALTPPRSLGVDLSERQEKALLKGLSIYPRTRFRSAEEFHTALYEGGAAAGPVPHPEPAPKPVEPIPEPEPVPEPAPEPEPESEQEPAAGKLLVWLKAHKKAAGIGAAALLAVVIIIAAIAAGAFRSDPTSSDPATSGSNVTDRPDNSAEASAPAYVNGWNLDQFEALMNDGSVTAIVIPEGQGLDINRPMEITKPVRLEPFAQLYISAEVTLSSTLYIPQDSDFYNNDFLTIAGGGRLEVDGYYGADGLLRTVDGGSIHIGGTGYAYFGTLWLEQAGDLDADSSRFDMDQRRYIVADEDALFENAVHVGSFTELENAVNDRRADAIVIDGSFEMEYWLTVSKPVLISEGAVLTARLDESGLIFGDVAVNRGRLEGELHLNSGGVWLNYGSCSDVTLYTEGSSCILNLGELRFRWGTDRHSAIVNLGHISLENDNDGYNLTILGSILMNYGDIDLVSGCLEFWANGHLNNFGTVRVSAGAALNNSGYLIIGGPGKLILEGNLQNDGGLNVDRLDDNLELRGGGIEGGLILTWEDASRLEATGAVRNATVLTFRDPDERAAEVGEAGELETLISSGAPVSLRVTGDIVFEGDLTLTRDLIVIGSLEVTGRLTMDGGALMTYDNAVLTAGSLELRNGAFLRPSGDGAVVRLNGGTLALYDSDVMICCETDLGGGRLELNNTTFFNWNEIRNVGGIRVDNSSYLYDWANIELSEGAGIDVDGGSIFVSNWMSVDGSVNVSGGGTLRFANGLHFCNGAVVTVAAGSRFEVDMGLELEGAKLDNSGITTLDGWESGHNLNGEIVNRSGGLVSLFGNVYGTGSLYNEGEVYLGWGEFNLGGEFNNRGRAWTNIADNAIIHTNWTGNALEYH